MLIGRPTVGETQRRAGLALARVNGVRLGVAVAGLARGVGPTGQVHVIFTSRGATNGVVQSARNAATKSGPAVCRRQTVPFDQGAGGGFGSESNLICTTK